MVKHYSGGLNRLHTVELLFEAKKPDLIEKILTKSPENLPEPETVGDKVMKAYARMRKKARD